MSLQLPKLKTSSERVEFLISFWKLSCSRLWLESSSGLFLNGSIDSPSALANLGTERDSKLLNTILAMRTDDGAKNLASSEPNTNQSADPPAPLELQASCIGDPEATTAISKVSQTLEKPMENKHPVVEVQGNGARAAAEVGEVVMEGAESVGETLVSSGPFVEPGESQEPLEAAEGVLAWAPEEDHEHKRVKVCLLFS